MTASSLFNYSDKYLAGIFSSVKSIAVIGASDNPNKASADVIKLLLEVGYCVFAVNPRAANTTIAGAPVFASLADIPHAVDMVDVFRPSRELCSIAEQAVAKGVKVLWTQLEIYDSTAVAIAEAAGLAVVVDRCPKVELPRLGLLPSSGE